MQIVLLACLAAALVIVPAVNAQGSVPCIIGISANCDGSGGTEVMFGFADSFDECRDGVVLYEPTANGVTWIGGEDDRKGECYAEYGQTGCSNNDVMNNCMITPACAGGQTQSCDGDGSESKVGVTNTFGECVALVKNTTATANGVTWGTEGEKRGECYAEEGQTTCKESSEWTNCQIIPECTGAVTKACDGTCMNDEVCSDTQVGVTDSFAECVALVKLTNPKANGATWGDGGERLGQCWAEFSQTKCGTSSDSWTNCIITPAF